MSPTKTVFFFQNPFGGYKTKGRGPAGPSNFLFWGTESFGPQRPRGAFSVGEIILVYSVGPKLLGNCCAAGGPAGGGAVQKTDFCRGSWEAATGVFPIPGWSPGSQKRWMTGGLARKEFIENLTVGARELLNFWSAPQKGWGILGPNFARCVIPLAL